MRKCIDAKSEGGNKRGMKTAGKGGGELHALTKLRAIVKRPMRGFLKEISSSYIGVVEKGSAVSEKLSDAIVKEYGAWIAPGENGTEVYQAFGKEWEAYQRERKLYARGTVLYAEEYESAESLLSRIKEVRKQLGGKKVRREIWIVPRRPLALREYTTDSYEAFKKNSEGKRDESVLLKRKFSSWVNKEVKKMIEIMNLIGEVGGDEARVEMFKALQGTLDQQIKKKELGGLIKKQYETHLHSLLDLYPSTKDEKGYYTMAAELDTDVDSNVDGSNYLDLAEDKASFRAGSLIGELPAPMSFENFKDWGQSGMEADQWERIYDEAQHQISSDCDG